MVSDRPEYIAVEVGHIHSSVSCGEGGGRSLVILIVGETVDKLTCQDIKLGMDEATHLSSGEME